jgi:hypothetical protein
VRSRCTTPCRQGRPTSPRKHAGSRSDPDRPELPFQIFFWVIRMYAAIPDDLLGLLTDGSESGGGPGCRRIRPLFSGGSNTSNADTTNSPAAAERGPTELRDALGGSLPRQLRGGSLRTGPGLVILSPMEQPPAEIPLTSDARRVLGLTRDERRLAKAVEEMERPFDRAVGRLEERRFDEETAQRLKDRLDDLLETMTTILYDEVFWDKLSSADRTLTSAEVKRLADVRGAALADLLRMAGYVNPPKPPVEELVDETLSSLAVALMAEDPHGSGAVSQAQSHIASMLYRVRRQIDYASKRPALSDHLILDAARVLGSGARWLIPKAAGLAAGAIIEAHAPASRAGVPAAKAAAKLAGAAVETLSSLGTTLAAKALRGGRHSEPIKDPKGRGRIPNEDPVQLHLAALTDQLKILSGVSQYDDESIEHYQNLIRTARRHLTRLDDLAIDHNLERFRTDVLPQFENAVSACEEWAAARAPLTRPLDSTQWAAAKNPNYRPFGRGPTQKEKEAILKDRAKAKPKLLPGP